MHVVWGKVKKGRKKGKRLGFPTANFGLYKKVSEGVYISRTKIGKEKFPSLTFIGRAKTFNQQKPLVETHILSFAKILYNQWVSVILLKKIRANKKFPSEKELIEQMIKDKKIAKEYFQHT